MLDVLLVNPGNQVQLFQELSKRETAIEPPVWCRLIASYVEYKGLSANILDAEAFGLDAQSAAQLASDEKPRLCVAVAHGSQPSASTQNMPAVIDFCRAFKKVAPDVCLLIVGGHPAALPEKTLEETGADFVCTGEGPVTVHSLAGFTKNERWRWMNKRDIPGVVYYDHDNLIKNDPAPNVWDLREMPGGQWNKLPMSLYRAHGWHCLQEPWRQPYASIYTTLGCPFQCSFCMIQAPFRDGDRMKLKGSANSYRMWPADFVLDEITTLVEKHGVTNIKIADEMFVLNYNHVKAIADGIKERGYGRFLNLWAYGRVDCTTEKYLSMLREMGVKWICLGIEAASNDVRDSVEKDDYGIEDIRQTCKRIQNAGINIISNFMVGLPSDTHESMQQTLDLAMELQTEWMNIYGTLFYPGAPLWQSIPEEKRNYDWKTYSHHSYEYTPAGNDNLTPAEVVRFRDGAFYKYFTDESYLRMIESKFGAKAVEEIRRMTAVKLRRRLLDT